MYFLNVLDTLYASSSDVAIKELLCPTLAIPSIKNLLTPFPIPKLTTLALFKLFSINWKTSFSTVTYPSVITTMVLAEVFIFLGI